MLSAVCKSQQIPMMKLGGKLVYNWHPKLVYNWHPNAQQISYLAILACRSSFSLENEPGNIKGFLQRPHRGFKWCLFLQGRLSHVEGDFERVGLDGAHVAQVVVLHTCTRCRYVLFSSRVFHIRQGNRGEGGFKQSCRIRLNEGLKHGSYCSFVGENLNRGQAPQTGRQARATQECEGVYCHIEGCY